MVTGYCLDEASDGYMHRFKVMLSQTTAMYARQLACDIFMAICSSSRCSCGALAYRVFDLRRLPPTPFSLSIQQGARQDPLNTLASLDQASRKAHRAGRYLGTSRRASSGTSASILTYPSAVRHTPARRLSPALVGAHRSPMHATCVSVM